MGVGVDLREEKSRKKQKKWNKNKGKNNKNNNKSKRRINIPRISSRWEQNEQTGQHERY